MQRSVIAAAGLIAACFVASGSLRAQVPTPAPVETPSTLPTPVPEATPTPQTAPSPTPPPIVVQPAAAIVAVGSSVQLRIGAIGPLTVNAANPSLVDVAVDQSALFVTLTGKAPGTTTVMITDSRGLSAAVPLRVAYNAGSIAGSVSVRITGDPARAEFVRDVAIEVARNAATARPGAQIVTSAEDLASFKRPLQQDEIVALDVPVLIQGEQFLTVQGTTRVYMENMAAPKIMPDSLLVSDYPERLESNGVLFAADLQRNSPSRFLYFHFNPPGAPERRVVLRAENPSYEPAVVQFITGAGGAGANEMEVGHDATRNFLVHLTQNEGRVIVIPARTAMNLVEQDMPANAVLSSLLQLRVLNGATVHLTLFAQDVTDSPQMTIENVQLLEGGHPHARGKYGIPEFHYSRLWNVDDPYLELSIGQIPLTNDLKGQALAGDYGVLQSFVIKIENSSAQPRAVAIYENPRGGRATGTFLIDGVLVQSHGAPAFSQYKLRQYIVPARGFVRVTIETIPEGGSSYPLRLIFAPDDGSVAPGAPGSPIY